MELFRPKIYIKQEKEESRHPWEKTIKGAYSHLYKYGHNSAKNPPFSKKKELVFKERIKIAVVGNRTSKEFIYCYYLIKGLYKHRKKEFEAPIIRGVTGLEWPKVRNDLKIHYGGKAFCIDSEVVVIVNDEFLGGENELREFVMSKYVYHLCLDYYHASIEQLYKFINSSGRPCAYMLFSINGEEIGNMIFMLYSDIVPRTCENFLRLCDTTKGGYSGTPVHRIVKDCWIQCGGFGLKNSPELDCENFIVPHDRRGVLCMTNDDRHVECSTQFFVLLQPAPWMQNKYVAFGQLIQGDTTLSKIENVLTWYESPNDDIIIYKAGVFNMDCHYIPKKTTFLPYINDHIENLFELADWIITMILDRVFKEIESKQKEEAGEEASVKKTSSPETTNTSGSINNEFDVEVYEYEGQCSVTKPTQKSESSLVVMPTKNYYLSLTDVPYPGEINSEYNLRKRLQGNYCYEADLVHDPNKRKRLDDYDRSMSIPEKLLGALFEYFMFGEEEDDSSESSVASCDKEIEKDYITEYIDRVSFSGPVIKHIANMPKKYEIFDEAKKHITLNRILTDDELRITRMALKEYNSTREKKVSITLSSSKLTHNKILRRPTGLICTVETESFEDLEAIEFNELLDREKRTSLTNKQDHMQHTGRESVLARLFEDVSWNKDEVGPTLKGFKPNMAKKSFTLLTFSPTYFIEDYSSKNLLRRGGSVRRSIDSALQLQHGSVIYRKLSSDYVRTIRRLEHKEIKSIRTVEYSKKRPAMSVAQYKLKNKQYQENLKNQINSDQTKPVAK